MELDVSEFDLPTTVRNAAMLVRQRAHRHGIELSIDVDPRLGAISADERTVKQILLNLLSNALKFTQEGGRVAVLAELTEGLVQISVTDTGAGFRRNIRTRFSRSSGRLAPMYASERERAWASPSLASSWSYTEGGSGWKVKWDEGAGFRLHYPTRQDEITPLQGGDVMTAGSILIVEDNERNAKLLRDVLGAKGYPTFETITAEEGLEVAREQRPALILMDISLPGMDASPP